MKIITVIFLLINSLDIICQDLNGYYKSNDYNYVKIFEDSLIEFSVLHGCCNRDYHQGNGKFKVIKDSIVVFTSTFNKSVLPAIKVISELSNIGDIEISVTDAFNNQYIGFPVIIKNKDGIYDTNYIDTTGNCLFQNLQKGSSIFIDYIDWGKANFDTDTLIGKKIIVDITPIHQVLNDSVYFKITNKDPITIEGLYYISNSNNFNEIEHKRPKQWSNRRQILEMHTPVRIELIKK